MVRKRRTETIEGLITKGLEEMKKQKANRRSWTWLIVFYLLLFSTAALSLVSIFTIIAFARALERGGALTSDVGVVM